MHFRNKVLSVEKLEKIDFEQKKLFENKLMGNKLSNIKVLHQSLKEVFILGHFLRLFK